MISLSGGLFSSKTTGDATAWKVVGKDLRERDEIQSVSSAAGRMVLFGFVIGG